MKNKKFDINNLGKIKLGYATAFLLLLFSYLGTLYANRRFIDQAKRIEHSNQIITDLERILSKISDAEAGIRGYWITGIEGYLTPYKDVKETSNFLYNTLIKQTTGNNFQQQRLFELRKDIDKRFSLFDYNLNLFNRNNKIINDSLLAMQVHSKAAMDRIRLKVNEIQEKEKLMLDERDKKVQRITNAIIIINIISVIIAAGLVIFGFISHAKENKAKQLAEKKMLDYQDQLKLRIEELAAANTELVRMRAQEKFAATGRIARTIAHEVRNPLTNINLAAEQLMSEMPANDENTGFLFDMINRNSSRINQLISDLLNSTKFTELNFTKISVNELLEQALKEANDRIALKNVEIIKKYSTDICDISVDNERIKIAFLNIIINALEAVENRPDGKLIVETKGEKDKCSIIISDNGIGMDKDALSRLFEPYFTSKPNGNGLGLTNTQNIILNHKGDIMVESKKGAGTTFIITLDTVS